MNDTARLQEISGFLCSGEGAIIEGKSGSFLTTTFNYERSFGVCGHMHDMSIVKRLLIGDIKLAQIPKKLYPAKYCRGRIEIVGKPLSWKRVVTIFKI